MFLALAQLTNKAFTDAGKGRIRQSLTALVKHTLLEIYGVGTSNQELWRDELMVSANIVHLSKYTRSA